MRRRGSSPFGTVLPTLLFWWGNPLLSPSCLSRHLRLKVRLKRGGSISYFTPSPAKNTVFKVNFVHYLTFSLPEWWGKVISPFQVPALFQHCNYNTGHTDWTKQSFWIVELLFFWAKAGRQQMNTYVRWWWVPWGKRCREREWDAVCQGRWRGQRPCLWWGGVEQK